MKPRIHWARPHVAALIVGALSLPGMASALTLDQALSLAEQDAPSLEAQAANVQAARSAAIPAGELPDPKLKLGLQNLPIEGDARWQVGQEAMTMQMVGVMQDVPNRAKRRARVEAAQARVALADAQQTIERLSVRQKTAEAWIVGFAVQQKLSLFQQLYSGRTGCSPGPFRRASRAVADKRQTAYSRSKKQLCLPNRKTYCCATSLLHGPNSAAGSASQLTKR